MSENTTAAENGTDATLADYDAGDEAETCPNGSEFCATTSDDELGCFDCFFDEERADDDEKEVVTDGGVDVAAAAADADATDLTDREVRGLTELLVVLPEAPGMATVFSEDGTPRTVDYEDGGCTCPDREYNDPDGPCKHEAAAAFLVGDQEIPEWVGCEEIDAKVARRTGE